MILAFSHFGAFSASVDLILSGNQSLMIKSLVVHFYFKTVDFTSIINLSPRVDLAGKRKEENIPRGSFQLFVEY